MATLGFADKNVIVYGLGRTGFATAFALAEDGATVTVYDTRGIEAFSGNPDGQTLLNHGRIVFAEPTRALLQQAAALVKSPGIAMDDPLIVQAVSLGVPIMGDVDLLYRREPQARFLGVTGTNGKSTTTALVGHIMQQAELSVAVGGNLGTPCLALPTSCDFYVLELSSFQLETMHEAVMNRAVLLNLTPDHLDRHGTLENYALAKKAIFARQTDRDVGFLGVDQAILADMAQTLPGVTSFSVAGNAADVALSPDGALVTDEGDVALGGYDHLPGKHNWQNALAALLMTRGLVSVDAIASAISSFRNLPHRMEKVAVIDHVAFYNDSKATNPESTCRALESFDNTYWIVGGLPKEQGLQPCLTFLAQVNAAFVIGKLTDEMADLLEGYIPTYRCYTLKEAVMTAWKVQQQEQNDQQRTVLLSPACASFDQFENFNHRGDAFINAVQDIINLSGSGHA